MAHVNDGLHQISFELREQSSRLIFDVAKEANNGIGIVSVRIANSKRIPFELAYCGNIRLLNAKRAAIPLASSRNSASSTNVEIVRALADQLVFSPMVIVCGIHTLAHIESSVVALRWGCPRILVLPGPLRAFLGEHLDQEAEESLRHWRSNWDGLTDLALSFHLDDANPSARTSDTNLNRFIRELATHQMIFKNRVRLVPET